MQQVVVIGGGTGTSTVLTGLKEYSDLDLSAIVVVSDSGGSTGRLRDEFGFLPVGDLRQCIAALAEGEQAEAIRDVLLYRFNNGEGLKGHNLGNLILTALSDLYDSPTKAVEVASRIFRVRGAVYPVTELPVDLVVTFADGTTIQGEKHLDDPAFGGKHITNLTITPPTELYPAAGAALRAADAIILGPGDLYASLLPNTLANGFTEALQQSTGTFIYIVNLMTHYSQTHEMSATDHIAAVTQYAGRAPDIVIMNTAEVPEAIQAHYASHHEYPVVDDIPDTAQYRVIRDSFLSDVAVQQSASDAVPRSVLRHHPAVLAKTVYQLISEKN